jgi:hypothetical protein
MSMENPHDGLGVTSRELIPGTAVMVAAGRGVTHVNGNPYPCVIAWAVVRGPATETDAATHPDPHSVWWLDVYIIPGGEPLPQMYRADEIIGIPVLGLHMDGAPAR